MQPAGYQLLLRVVMNSAEVSCLAIEPSSMMLAAGDATGAISLIDLSQVKPLNRGQACCASLSLLDR